MSHRMTKPTKWPVRPVKTQISLGICPAWTQSLMCSQWVAMDLSFLHVDSKDWSDWTNAQADRSLHWVHRSFCWFCWVAAHVYFIDLVFLLFHGDAFIILLQNILFQHILTKSWQRNKLWSKCHQNPKHAETWNNCCIYCNDHKFSDR